MILFNSLKRFSTHAEESTISSYSNSIAFVAPSTQVYSSSITPSLINMEWLSCQPLMPFLTQLIPTHLLYRSILYHGFENCIEIIEWIRGEQLQKLLDFDIWEKSHELDVEDICVDKVMSWLDIWISIDPAFAAERFFELEEETMCLIMSKIFEIIPDGINEISEDVEENWWKTLDNKFYLRIRNNPEQSFDILKIFIDALYTTNIKLAGSLLAYSCMLIRQESLEAGLHWRANRIADQGFVTLEEARKTLFPKKLSDLKKFIFESGKLENTKLNNNKKKASFLFHEEDIKDKLNYVPEEFDAILKLLISLKSEEGSRFALLALGDNKIRSLIGFSNVNIEQVYEDETFINDLSEQIYIKTKNILMHLEFNSNNNSEATLLIEKTLNAMAENSKYNFSLIKQSIAHLANCIHALVDSKQNYHYILNSILIARGAINIGLELCLKMPKDYGLIFVSEDNVLNAQECISKLGINFLFHLGWNLLFKVEEKLTTQFSYLDMNHPEFKGKLNTIRSIQLSDQSTLKVSIEKLILNLRFADITKWINSCQELFSNEIFYTVKALLSSVPHYPKTLDNFSNYVTTEMRPFETLDDVDKVFQFIDNLNSNLSHLTK